jgi:arsenite-transporting ATPase
VADTTSVRLVVTPERMVIDEARRTWTDLALFELPCDALVMNRLLPEAAVCEAFFADWGRLQEERLREVEALFAPLPLLAAPLQDDEVTGLERLAAHGAAIFRERSPEAVLSRAPRVAFEREERGYVVSLPLPNADPELLEVAKVDDELVVRAGPLRRALRLPRRIAPLDLAGAHLAGGRLRVRFAR